MSIRIDLLGSTLHPTIPDTCKSELCSEASVLKDRAQQLEKQKDDLLVRVSQAEQAQGRAQARLFCNEERVSSPNGDELCHYLCLMPHLSDNLSDVTSDCFLVTTPCKCLAAQLETMAHRSSERHAEALREARDKATTLEAQKHGVR